MLPADLDFADALKSNKVPLRVHLGLYQNETAELCQWHVNRAHELEAWGDARAYDGTVSIIQPLIAPLYGGKSANWNSSRCSPVKPMRPDTICPRLLAEAAHRRGLRAVLAQVAARWLDRGHGVPFEEVTALAK
jgi:anaerobic selenocysteine-containing dehydrogenase